MVRAGGPSIAPRLLDRRQLQKESHQATRLRNTVVQQQAGRTRPTLEDQGPSRLAGDKHASISVPRGLSQWGERTSLRQTRDHALGLRSRV
jgi:hypothetical protein